MKKPPGSGGFGPFCINHVCKKELIGDPTDPYRDSVPHDPVHDVCGYSAYFQNDIAGYVGVPVFMSSLLQVPLAQQLIGPDRLVGILVAREDRLTQAHLEAVGIQPGGNYVINGAEGRCPEFQHFGHV